MPKHMKYTVDALIYEQIVGELLFDPLKGESLVAQHYDEDGDGIADRPATTAGEEDHSDPWIYAGEPADAPMNSEGGDA